MTVTRILTGDARKLVPLLPDQCINLVLTSPAFWGARDYGVAEQLGREPTVDKYIANLVGISREVHRLVRDDGAYCVNLGDCYRNKRLALIPERFVIAMSEQGWYVRNKIIWHKPDGKPESAKDRFTMDYEVLFIFTKRKRYHFDLQFQPFKTSPSSPDRRRPGLTKNHKNLHIPGQQPHGMHLRRANGEPEINYDERGARMRSVWSISTARFKDKHFAVYPEALIEPIILACCPEGGIVLDPFLGSGTTAIVCERLGRNCLGIELNPAYVEIAKKRIREARGG